MNTYFDSSEVTLIPLSQILKNKSNSDSDCISLDYLLSLEVDIKSSYDESMRFINTILLICIIVLIGINIIPKNIKSFESIDVCENTVTLFHPMSYMSENELEIIDQLKIRNIVDGKVLDFFNIVEKYQQSDLFKYVSNLPPIEKLFYTIVYLNTPVFNKLMYLTKYAQIISYYNINNSICTILLNLFPIIEIINVHETIINSLILIKTGSYFDLIWYLWNAIFISVS